MNFALWTRRAVCELIKQELGLSMPIRTCGEYLKRWGFTPQKPAKRAYEQNPDAVAQWMEETPKHRRESQKPERRNPLGR